MFISVFTGDVNLGHLVKVMAAGSLHCDVSNYTGFPLQLINIFGTMPIFCFSQNFHPLILASIRGFCLQQLLLWCLPDDVFVFPPFLPNLLIGIFSVRKSCPSSTTCPSSVFLPLRIWICGCLFGFLKYSPIHSLLTLRFTLFQLWPLAASSEWILCSFDMPSFFFKHLFFLISQGVSDPSCISPAPVQESTIFVRNPNSF